MRHHKYDDNRYQSLWEHNHRDIKHTFFGTIANKNDLYEVLLQPITASFSMLVGGIFTQFLLPFSIFALCIGDMEFAGNTFLNYIEITTLALLMPVISLLSTLGRSIATLKCMVEEKYDLQEMVEDCDVEENKIYLDFKPSSFTVTDKENNVIERTYYIFNYKMKTPNSEICDGQFTLTDLDRHPKDEEFNGKLFNLKFYKYDILHLIKAIHKLEEMENYEIRRSYGYA